MNVLGRGLSVDNSLEVPPFLPVFEAGLFESKMFAVCQVGTPRVPHWEHQTEDVIQLLISMVGRLPWLETSSTRAGFNRLQFK